MTQPMGMADFFTMEAGEYLERLDGMVSPPTEPDFHEFHRLARALRGSALMARQQQVAKVAGGLEAMARAVREGTLSWDESARQLAIRAVDDLKVLVRAVHNWSSEEDARSQRIAAELERVAGAPVTTGEVEVQKLDAGTRAFIAREGAAVGSALDQAAKALGQDPNALEPLEAVLRATQPIRGIASLSDLPPLPDLLDGIERAIRELKRNPASIPYPGDLFDAAAKAISTASQEIATGGVANPDSPEAVEFAKSLGYLLEQEPEIVPIETLYHDGSGPHIVSEGAPPPAADDPAHLEILSLAENLKQAADDLERAESNTQRQLRVHALTPTLRALGSASREATEFVNALRDTIHRGAATTHTKEFAQQLREAGTVLSEQFQAGRQGVSRRLEPIVARISGMGTQPAAGTEPVEAAPAAAQPAAVAQPAPQPAATHDEPDVLAAAMSTYQQLVAADGAEAPLATLLAGPIEAAAAVAAAPAVGAAPAAARPTPERLAPITDYCYTGASAMAEAARIRERLRQVLPVQDAGLLEEYIDLVELGSRQSS